MAPRQPLFQPAIGQVQRPCGFDQRLVAARGVLLDGREHGLLHRGHHVVVEEAVEEAHLQRLKRVFGQPAGASAVPEHQVFDDDGRLDDRVPIVDQQRKAREGPAFFQLGHRCRVFERPVLEGHVVLVEGNEHLLAVGRKGVGVERERHEAPEGWVTCSRPGTIVGRPRVGKRRGADAATAEATRREDGICLASPGRLKPRRVPYDAVPAHTTPAPCTSPSSPSTPSTSSTR